MPSKNYLSNKRNDKISFATSDALKDWINRYLHVKHAEDPKDKRYKSISSFLHYALESLMKTFESGKTLDDFAKFVDSEVEDFYDNMTFKAVIWLYEDSIELNKYQKLSNELFRFILAFRNFIIQEENYSGFSRGELLNFLMRFKNFVVKNKVTENIEGYVDGNEFIIEYRGKYANIHFEYSKIIASIFGAIGFRVTKIDYMNKYIQFRVREDSLFKMKKLSLKERKSLIKYNLSHFIRFDRILNDKFHHFWMEISGKNSFIVSFRDLQTGVEYCAKKIEELGEIVPYPEIPKYILKLFEKFHWIIVDNLSTLSFRYNIPKDGHEIEYQIMENFLFDTMKSSGIAYKIL